MRPKGGVRGVNKQEKTGWRIGKDDGFNEIRERLRTDGNKDVLVDVLAPRFAIKCTLNMPESSHCETTFQKRPWCGAGSSNTPTADSTGSFWGCDLSQESRVVSCDPHIEWDDWQQLFQRAVHLCNSAFRRSHLRPSVPSELSGTQEFIRTDSLEWTNS
jgi:hypothetical protein